MSGGDRTLLIIRSSCRIPRWMVVLGGTHQGCRPTHANIYIFYVHKYILYTFNIYRIRLATNIFHLPYS